MRTRVAGIAILVVLGGLAGSTSGGKARRPAAPRVEPHHRGHVAGPDACPTSHFHAPAGTTITIDGKGPFADPHPTSCGFGPIVPCS